MIYSCCKKIKIKIQLLNKQMVKLIITAITLFPFLFAGEISASERPKGLEDRGPLTKITFIHHKKGMAKPEGIGKGNNISCYGFLGKGVYWKNNLPRTLYVNTESFTGLDSNFVLTAISNSAEEWDSATVKDLYSTSIASASANWDDASPDGQSELVQSLYPDAGVIAVTNVWGYFAGPINTREIVDFDILFNSSFAWGDATSDSSKMDLANIATHELGHGWGLGDIYQSGCSLVTMYGYSTEGEISKRSLESADISGLTRLYY